MMDIEYETPSQKKQVISKTSGADYINPPDVFTLEDLERYYEQYFPFDLFEGWLAYGDKSEAKETTFSKREFTFTLEDDIYCRYRSFPNFEQMKKKVVEMKPVKIDIGAMFNHNPVDKDKIPDKLAPVMREYVIDIDMSDYNDIRTCCSVHGESNICSKCWQFMAAAAKVLDAALREDFGFKNIIWVYSGRRGIHCWVADPTARYLKNEERAAVTSYLSIAAGSEGSLAKVEPLKPKLHPHIKRSYKILRKYFEKVVVEEQNILENKVKVDQMLNIIRDEELRSRIKRELNNKGKGLRGKEIWEMIKSMIPKTDSSMADDKKRDKSSDQYHIIEEIVLTYLYPRIDINVSKTMNHLLKAPYCVHPKTGRVCIPLNIMQIDSFDPQRAPIMNELISMDKCNFANRISNIITSKFVKHYNPTRISKRASRFSESLSKGAR